MLNKTLIRTIKELYSIPNAPFSISSRTEYVIRKLNEAGWDIENTPYFIRGYKAGNVGKQRLFLVSHLDHPGFVFKNSKEAIAFGSLYLDRVKDYKAIKVYSPSGKYLGKSSIEGVFGKDYSRVRVKSDFDIPKNSQGLWDVGDVEFDPHYIYGLSHDNDILSAILLSLIEKANPENLDVQVIFTKHEEVLQLSSFNLSKNNTLGISNKDIVINLESMKVYPITESTKFSNLNYKDGVVLNVSEATSIYGRSGLPNFSESLVNNICRKLKIKLQRGLAGGNSDARAISYYNLTNNIITLNIPNQYKHNCNGESIVPEQVKVSDVSDLYTILSEIITSYKDSDLSKNVRDISVRAKSLYPGFARSESEFYATLNRRLDIVFKDVIRRGYYFPVNLYEVVIDFFLRIYSYLIVSRKQLNRSLSAE